MSAARTLPLLRLAGRTLPRAAPLLRTGVSPRLAAPVPAPAAAVRALHASVPRFSADPDTAWAARGPIAYAELKRLTQAPPPDVTLIDVREPDEVAAGIIPSAVNVPLSRFSEAFNPMKGADFQREFAFERPAFGDKVIFYCRSGKRSQQALETAQKNGWVNARNYTGSWLDWVKREESSPGHD